MTEQDKIRLADLVERVLERLAIKIETGDRPEYTAARETWTEYRLPGTPNDQQVSALLSGNLRQAARALREAV